MGCFLIVQKDYLPEKRLYHGSFLQTALFAHFGAKRVSRRAVRAGRIRRLLDDSRRHRSRKTFNFRRHGRARLGRGRATQPKVVGERQLAPGKEELQQSVRIAVVVEGRVEAPGDLVVHHHLLQEVVYQGVIRVTYRETSLVELE